MSNKLLLAIIFILIKALLYQCQQDEVVYDEAQQQPQPSAVLTADGIRDLKLIFRHNDFERPIRRESHRTGKCEETVLVYLPVSSTQDHVKELTSQIFCAPFQNAATDPALCEKTLKLIHQAFNSHSEKENWIRIQELLEVKAVDFGFAKRIEERDLRRQQYVNIAPESTIRSKSNTEQGRYQAGDLAVIISGYWYSPITRSFNHTKEYPHDHWEDIAYNPEKNPYLKWMDNSLAINMPYMIFADIDMIPILIQKRMPYPSLYIPYQLENFYMKDDELLTSEAFTEHEVPSRNNSQIWLEKMHLIYLGSQIEPNSDYYVWMDAALSSYRNVTPPSWEWSTDMIAGLPKDRISYCHVHWEHEYFAAGVIVIPKAMIRLSHYLFYEYHRECMENRHDWKCGWEEYIWTLVVEDFPELFHRMCYGYGKIEALWGTDVN